VVILWLVLCLVLCAAVQPGCERSEPAAPGGAGSEPAGRVVLYTSADESLARAVVGAFELRTGIEVVLVGDTEATKTVGLYRRLLDEQGSPRADVWWSSEPFYTVRLARSGVLAPLTVEEVSALGVGSWPAWARGSEGSWFGFGLRARVIAYDERKVSASEAPRTLRDLAEERWRGKVGMARPVFGTTAGHLAALVHVWGAEPVRSWLTALEGNGLRLYDSNSAVVRALAEGEIEVGLTDTDDVWSGRGQGWRIGLVYESDESAGPAEPGAVEPLGGFGALVLPNTVGLVRGGPNAQAGRQLAAFLLSADGERLLMTSESANVPVRAALAAEQAAAQPQTVIDPAGYVDLEAAAERLEEARAIAADVLGV
jgi:iron(III) transport system substrate-binding protein